MLAGLARAAIAPALSAAILVGLLSAWVMTGGAGSLRRVYVQVGLAAIPLSFAPHAAHATTTTYIVIKNLAGPDELLAARTPIARQAVLVRDGRTPSAPGSVLPGLAIPAGGTTSLNPFGTDIVLLHPAELHSGEVVPLTLVFRHAGTVRIDATVTSSLTSP
ncbi:MAG TPA: copper chaperone PCu(A)C [Streptosporangiaceae bacterium]|nr:copper chaperone PCu(A)C [Streptosporangiaceae bacterium]